MESLTTQVVIAGGGPAGLMCGYLLARAGIEVWVLEKHADFLRDFRGDTIHPSTLELMDELGLLERFLNRPHDEVREVSAEFGKDKFTVADMTRLPTRAKFMVFMPQWEFLNFLLEEAKRFPTFHIVMEAEVRELLVRKKRIVGVRLRTPEGEGDILARLVIGADGRHSKVREKAKLKVQDIGAPFDVLWMKLPAEFGDPHEPVGRFATGGLFIMLNRRTYWQCAMVIPKGAFTAMKTEGISGFRGRLRTLAGFARDRVETIESFEDVKLLTVSIDRLKRWARPGLLCIGDAAHAMSPVGGVGINLAIQDAVAAANILAPVLQTKAPSLADLKRVQERREFPTKVTQWAQVQIQKRVLAGTIRSQVTPKPPIALHLLNRFRWLRQFPARFVGLGVRPEHVRSPLAKAEPRATDSAPT